MTTPTKAIQDLEVINIANEDDLLLVVNSSNGKVHLIKKSSLIKESEQQIPLSPIKKFRSLTEAKESEAEEYDIAVIAGRIYVYVN